MPEPATVASKEKPPLLFGLIVLRQHPIAAGPQIYSSAVKQYFLSHPLCLGSDIRRAGLVATRNQRSISREGA